MTLQDHKTDESSCSHLSTASDEQEEEQDLANCLILLANGGPVAAAEIYACKTCNKAFPSFQALGGHRASHRKVIKPPSPPKEKLDYSDGSSMLALAIAGAASSSKAARAHECSICGVAFSSGQALGGHMRRHRPLPLPPSKKARNGLSLDLNLPAPEDQDHKEARFPQALVFSTSPLVDCQY